jgi:CheY-like chemotaxis protein
MPDNRVLLEVSDDGPGIPDAILGRIFDPFFTTKPEGEGTGLGLSVALAIVREHGGHVHVQSQPSGGAVFTLDFPAYSSNSRLADRRKARTEEATVEARSEAEPGQRVADASSRHGRNNRPRVLVLEDEPTVARLIADVLEEEGCRVDILLDSREAVQRATTRTYDLAVCDMKMPGIGGQDFYEALVRSGNPLRDRLLFVTGDVIAAQTHAFLRRSQRPHVAKPFRVEELTQKVRQVLTEINTGASTNTTFRSNTASE